MKFLRFIQIFIIFYSLDQLIIYEDDDDNEKIMSNSSSLRKIKSSFAKDSKVTESGTKIRWENIETNNNNNNETSPSTNRSSDAINIDQKTHNPLPSKKDSLRRLDQYGNPIKRGGKTHRIVFADNKVVNKPIREVHEVESFKYENLSEKKQRIYEIHNERKQKKSLNTDYCQCLVF